jgi:hypothetical protein
MSVPKIGDPQRVTNATQATLSGDAEGGVKAALRWIVPLALALGFALRLRAALGTYLNPDEALHYQLINQASAWQAYLASLTNAHPPFYFLFLYFWHFVGNSEWMLRLPSVAANTAACWLAYRWISIAVSKAAGLVTILLLAFSPVLIRLAGEVRDYSFLLLWISATLYFLERAYREQKAAPLAASALFLYLAILTHYSALWCVLAAGCYGLLRVLDFSPRLRMLWAASQGIAAAMYVWLYVSHISKIHGSPMEAEAMTGWLRNQYLRAGQSPVDFLHGATLDVFQFLFASLGGGDAALLLFAVGIAGLLVAGVLRKKFSLSAFGLLLLLPFVFGIAAALLDLYPFGGSRHSVYLLLFATAGVSVAVSTLLLQRPLPILLLAVIVLPYWQRHALADPQQMGREEQQARLMTGLLSDLKNSVPPSEPIFTDYQASILLSYYLGRDQPPLPAKSCAGLSEFHYGPYTVINIGGWSATAPELEKALQSWHAACDSQHRESYWVFDAGWGLNLLDDLKQSAPDSISQARKYAQTISLFQVKPPR